MGKSDKNVNHASYLYEIYVIYRIALKQTVTKLLMACNSPITVRSALACGRLAGSPVIDAERCARPGGEMARNPEARRQYEFRTWCWVVLRQRPMLRAFYLSWTALAIDLPRGRGAWQQPLVSGDRARQEGRRHCSQCVRMDAIAAAAHNRATGRALVLRDGRCCCIG